MWPKSKETLSYDLQKELSVDYTNAANSFMALKVQNEINRKIEVDNKNFDSTTFKQYVKKALESKSPEYQKLSRSPFQALKNLYRISLPNFILDFMDMNKDIIPEVITNKITPIVSNTVYNKHNSKISNYIQKICLLKTITSLDKRGVEYYNYCRFVSLYNIIVNNNLIPVSYNPHTGVFYFTIPYNMYNQKEQIFESIHNNLFSTTIENVRYYINTQYGEISTVRKLFDKRVKHYKTDISDQMDFTLPNIIRMIIHDLFNKFANPNYKLTYIQMLGYRLRNTLMVEDYCEKLNRDGSLFNVPLTTGWTTMGSKEVRVLNKSLINESLLLESYDELLNTVKQTILNFQN